jgi:hypothetical protein
MTNFICLNYPVLIYLILKHLSIQGRLRLMWKHFYLEFNNLLEIYQFDQGDFS